MKRKLLSWLLAIVLLAGLLPAIAPTAKADGTITIYAINDVGWNSMSVHYWVGDTQTTWPGMTMQSLYNGRVWSAEIPDDVTGIVFTDGASSGTKQTVDITSGISDGATWTVNSQTENGNGNYTVSAFYLVGTMNSWTPNDNYRLSLNLNAAEPEYMLPSVQLAADAELKICSSTDAWYPANLPNYKVDTAGTYTVFFRPSGNVSGWYGGCFTLRTPYDVKVNPSPHGTVTADKAVSYEGDTVTLTVTPDQGAKLASLSYVDSNDVVTEITGNSFVMPASNVKIQATFDEKYVVTLDPGVGTGTPETITSLDDGVWAEDRLSSSNGQFVQSGSNEEFCYPNCPQTFSCAGRSFVGWVRLGGVSLDSPGQFMDAGTYTLVAAWSLPDGYYLVGSDRSIADIDVNNKFETNPENESEQLLYTTLSEGNEIKVVRVQNDGIVGWYPDGLDNQYHVDAAHAGYVAICFKPNYDSSWSTFGGYMWIEKVTTPAFRTQAAVLSDQIGVRFFVDLNMLTEQERNASYMTFAISGRGSVTDQNIVADSTNKKGYKGFTCKVNAIQMADTITATLHYGDGQTIEKTYSVKEYIEKWDELHPNDTSDTTKLIHALADYGHYAQIFLSAYNHWGIGNGDDQYASMSKFYTNSGAFEEAAIKASAVENQPMTVSHTGNPGTFLNPTMSLALDSETAIRVHFSTADGREPEFTVKDKDNHDVTFTTRKSGSTYVVEIAGVKAKWLLNGYTVTATLGEDTQTVGLSAATYVGRMLSAVAYNNDQKAHDVVCALWTYAQIAANYNG